MNRCPTCNRPFKRSHSQNAYLWAVPYAMIAEHTGHSSEEIHEYCKTRFLPKSFMVVNGLEIEVRKSTTELTVGEFAEYVTRVCSFAQNELGLNIPVETRR